MLKKTFLLLACWCCGLLAEAQNKTPEEYEKNFPADFYEAMDFIKQNKSAFLQELRKDGGDAQIITSIVFPEMVRFSELSNLFETASIEVLYVKFGAKYADFSIGIFQMKPSFIEKLEKYAQEKQMTAFASIWKYEATDEAEIRQARLSRMKKLAWQLHYLRVFYAIASVRFANQATTLENKVRFLATAYNRGFDQSEEEIGRWTKIAAFPHGTRYRGKQYNYADIAYYFYQKYSYSLLQ